MAFEDYFKWLYEQVTEYDILKTAIKNYSDDRSKNSIIEGFATTYASAMLTHRKFWSIQPSRDHNGALDTHLRYYSINATDFNSGTPFGFISQRI